MRKVTLVFGAYQGNIEIEPGEKVAFIGDCCRWEGELDGEPVKIDGCYTHRRHRDPHTASMTDIYIEMARFYETVFANRNKRYARLGGCPVSVAEVVLTLVSLGGTKNPYMLPSTVIPFCTAWSGWRMSRMWRAATGRPYMARGRDPIPAPATPAAFVG